jgi:hypothetical protein
VGRILLSSVADLAQISNFMKIRLVGSELFHGDGRTDRQAEVTNLVVAFYNFANAPKNSTFWSYSKFLFLVKI